MRTLSIAALFMVLGLAVGATLASQPAANALVQVERAQPSIMIDQLTAAAKNLPVQSFDAF